MTVPNGGRGKLPRHIAIIMDGNGRWAVERGFGRIRGHREGARRVDEIVTACTEIGIPFLTLYAFSTENWRRPSTEVRALMGLLVQHLRSMDAKLIRNRVALRAKGRLMDLPKAAQRELDRVITETSSYEPRMTLTLCLSYGGRQEIVDAARAVALEALGGKVVPAEIDESLFSRYLYQPDVPEPDLLIRTGGEHRVSNFLLWEIAYTELYVTETRWPDFGAVSLKTALSEFANRERRFGKTSAQVAANEPMPAGV